jgi:cytochrome c553
MGQADGSAPVIAAQHRGVVLRQLVDYRYGLRWDLRMEHVAQMRNLQMPQDLADVAAYVATLVQQNERIGMGRGEHLALGARRFVERCAECHGATGQGDAGKSVPKLAGQHHAYLLRQFLDVLEGRRPALGASHRRLLTDFDLAVADGIADYLSRNSRASTADQ